MERPQDDDGQAEDQALLASLIQLGQNCQWAKYILRSLWCQRLQWGLCIFTVPACSAREALFFLGCHQQNIDKSEAWFFERPLRYSQFPVLLLKRTALAALL